jgi:hypothetical protein
MELIEHKYDELLASSFYLVACYRVNEDKPYKYLLYTGSDIVCNKEYFEPNYRYYLLPR